MGTTLIVSLRFAIFHTLLSNPYIRVKHRLKSRQHAFHSLPSVAETYHWVSPVIISVSHRTGKAKDVSQSFQWIVGRGDRMLQRPMMQSHLPIQFVHDATERRVGDLSA